MVRKIYESWRINLWDKRKASEVVKILQGEDWQQQLEAILPRSTREEWMILDEARKNIGERAGEDLEARNPLVEEESIEAKRFSLGRPWLTGNVVSSVLWRSATRKASEVETDRVLELYRWAETKAVIGGSWQGLHYLFPLLFKAGRGHEVGKIARPLLNAGRKPNLAICSIMIRGTVTRKDVATSLVLIEGVVLRGRTMLPVTDFRFIIRSLCKLGKMDSAVQCFRWMIDVYGSTDERTLAIVMDALCRRKVVEEALRIYDEVVHRGCRIGLGLLEIVVTGILSSRTIEEVYALFAVLSGALDEVTVCAVRERVLGQPQTGTETDAGSELWKSLDRVRRRGYDPTLQDVFRELCRRIQPWQANELLRLMLDKGIVFDRRGYEVVVEALCRAGFREDGLGLLREMFQRRITPGAKTFDVMAEGFATTGRLDRVMEVYRAMEEAGYTLRASSYGILVTCLCKSGNFDEAYKLLETMRQQRFRPKAIAYSTVINWLCKLNRVDEARRLVQKMAKSYAPPDAQTYGPIVERLCKTQKIDEAVAVVAEEMAATGTQPDALIYNFVLNGLFHENRTEEARELFATMARRKIVPTAVTYNTVIAGLCKACRIDAAYETFREMIARRIVPTEVTYNILIDGFCKKKDLGQAKSVFDEMIRGGLVPNVITYTTLIDGLAKCGKVDAAREIMDGMVKNNKDKNRDEKATVSPNAATYSCLIDALCKARRVDDAQKLLEEMVGQGIAPTVVTYNILVNSLCRADKLDDAFKLFRGMAQRRCHPTVVTYNTLLRCLCHHRLLDRARGLFSEMIDRGCPPDAITYDTLVWGLTRAGKIAEAQELMERMKLTKRNRLGGRSFRRQ